MDASTQRLLPLTTAQRGLWVSHKVAPTANLNIAEAVEIFGHVEPQIVQQALRQIVSEAEELRVSIIEQNGLPAQLRRLTYQGNFPYLDMSAEADPRSAIEAWMSADLAQSVDLAQDPLWTSALLKAGDESYFWYQRAHHIVYDGYGGGLVARRLAELYTAYVRGNQALPNRFSTVETLVEAEASYRNSDRFQRDREYWRAQLADMPNAVTLSSQNRRNGLHSTLLRSTGHIPPETTRRLSELGKSVGASFPQVLISLIAAYYQQVTGVKDLVFGLPVSGRLNSSLRNSVSISANIVPIRLRFTPEMTPDGLFVQVARTVRQALRHQQYRYEDLRRDLGLFSRDQNIAWLNVNIEPFDYQLNFHGNRTLAHNMSNGSTEDLMVFVYDRGTDTDLRFDLDANPSLYSAQELDEHKRRLIRLIEQVLVNPNQPLRSIDILGEEERYLLLNRWNDTAMALPYIGLPALVAQWASQTPNAPAIVFENDTVSYRQLHRRSVLETQRLYDYGVRPGDMVAVALPRSERLLITLLAIMRIGAAYLPVDLDSPVERTALILEDAAPTVLITEPSTQPNFLNGTLRLLDPEDPDFSAFEPEEEIDLSWPDGIAYVLYTSGSTGRPKGVQVTHRNLCSFLQGMQHQLMPIAADRFLAVTTIIFDIAGLELYLPLTVGASLVVAPSELVHNPPALARLIKHRGVTHVQATPSLWRILLASPETDLDGVHALVGGEALGADLAGNLIRLASRVTQFYGPTETTVWSTAFELEETGGVPPIGRPILNTVVYVLNEDLRPVIPGRIGELYIGGAGVARGYLNRPDLTSERFIKNPFADDGGRIYRTGDLVRWNDKGLLEFIGRVDSQVKINGHRIELGEIENHLLQHETVSEAVVVTHREADSTMTLVCYLVATSGMAVDRHLLRQFLARRLPNYMIPASFMVLEAMPLTPNGKLDRKALPAMEVSVRTMYAEPVTPMEKKLAHLWQEILGLERIGLHDNFFDLGGDSLNAAEMIACFPKYFDMELPITSLFEAPTISHLVPLIERLSDEHNDLLNVVMPLRKAARGVRPLFCIHPMSGISLGFASLLKHIDSRIPIYGVQSRGLQGEKHLPESVDEIARDYIVEIQRIQPEGPYRIVGRSLGGLIAHSIAAQMQTQGLQVELLAMIDTHLFTTGEFSHPLTGKEEVRAALSFLGVHLDEADTPQTLTELAELLLRSDNNLAIPLTQGITKFASEILKKNPEFMRHLSDVMLNNLKLARQHIPTLVNTDLIYFQAMETTGDVDGILDRNPSAWRPFVGRRLEVHELACHHEFVMDPVPAAQIGRALQQHLSRLSDRWRVEAAPVGHEEGMVQTNV